MLLILPPSETKRDGGAEGSSLDPAGLSFLSLTPTRKALLSAVSELAADLPASLTALKLSAKQQAEVERNRVVGSAPTAPAIDRYTGVLFDALDAASLDDAERAFAARHVVIHSALFGLLGALDEIPAYRLSHDSRLPGLPLARAWGGAIERELAATEGPVLDLRSESYAKLGRAPRREGSVFVRVVAEDGAGRRRALNHFNKKGKGEFVRAFLRDRPAATSLADVMGWASGAGFPMSPGQPGEVELVVANALN